MRDGGPGGAGVARRSFDAVLDAASRVRYQSDLSPLLRLHGHLQAFSLSLRAADGAADGVLLFANMRRLPAGPVYDLLLVLIRPRHRLEDEMLRVKRAADESLGMIFQLRCLPDDRAMLVRALLLPRV